MTVSLIAISNKLRRVVMKMRGLLTLFKLIRLQFPILLTNPIAFIELCCYSWLYAIDLSVDSYLLFREL